MTSKTSSSKPLLYTFFRGLKGPALAPAIVNSLIFVLFALLEPLTNYARDISFTNESGELIVQKASEMYKYYLFSASDLVSIFFLIAVCSTSIAAAVFSFSFITSKKTVNVYYSLGISRDKLYFGKFLSGAVLMILSIAVPFLLAFVANIIFIGYSTTLLMVVIFYILSLCATSLIVFSVTAAAFAAVGTFFEAATFSTIILAFPTIFFSSLETFMKKFVHGSPYGSIFRYANSPYYSFYQTASEKLIWKFDFLNPLFFDYGILSKWGAMDTANNANPSAATFTRDILPLVWYPSILRAICWIFISIAIMFVGTYIFQKRKAEICGFIGINKILNTFATFTVGFFFLNVTIGVASDYLSNILALLIGFAVFTVIYIGLEMLLLRDLKAFVRGLYKLPAQMAVAGAIVAVFMTGLFGYSSKIPNASEITKVAVTPAGLSSEYGYLQNAGYSTLGNWEDFSYTNATGLIDGFTSQKDIKLISALHEKLIKLGVVKLTDYNSDEDIPENERVLGLTLQFVYTLKNGKTVMRSYNAATPDILKSFLELEDTDFYNQRLKTIFNEKLSDKKPDKSIEDASGDDFLEYAKQVVRNEDNNITIITQNAAATLNLTFTMAEKAELARCLYMDLSKRTAEEKYFPKENPLGIINFSLPNYFPSPNWLDMGETEPGFTSTTEPTTEDDSTTQSDTSQALDNQTSTTPTVNQPVKISPLSAPPQTDPSENTTTEKEESTTAPNTDGTTDMPQIPDDENGEEEMQGTVLNKAIKFDKRTSLQLIPRGFSGDGITMPIVLTSDMENTIRFLKLKGLYNELLDKSSYTSAQVISVVRYNKHNLYMYINNDRYSSVDRLFSGSYVIEPKANKNSQDNMWSVHSLFDDTNNYTALTASEVSELYKASRFVYYNNYDTGYYIRFLTADKTEKITMFIPTSLMPNSIKSKITQFESTNDYYNNSMYGPRYYY
ncbi:MAG: ABC transporter permease subunit [Clostridiales bacterium]|nr:ABC transporter permease subunit [Clostridiales bacterium]